MIRLLACCILACLAACAGRRPQSSKVAPAPASDANASPAARDSLWNKGHAALRHGKGGDAQNLLNRAVLEFDPGDPRVPQAHFYLGEAPFDDGSQLEAAREFRKTSDETP